MSFSIHKAGLALGILLLLVGSLIQTFDGIAGPSPPQVWGLDDAYIYYGCLLPNTYYVKVAGTMRC
jgi:hypothetical protein